MKIADPDSSPVLDEFDVIIAELPLLNAKVLELGCGKAENTRKIASSGKVASVVAMEVDEIQHGKNLQVSDLPNVTFLRGAAESIPADDGSFDVVMMFKSLHHVPIDRMDAAFTEIHRVLKPGGRFVCLEFSRPMAWLAPLYDLYSFLVIPRLGAAVAGEPQAYQYLIESIRRFPDQPGFATLMQHAGFDAVHWENLSFGIACLHFGTRKHES